MSFRDLLELASFLVTVIGLPFAIGVFFLEQRREREKRFVRRQQESAHRAAGQVAA